MAYLANPDTSILQGIVNPLDMEAKGFALGQRQLQAKRETEQYDQAQAQQRALKDIFQQTDTSTPEGKADAIRKVKQVNPQLGTQMESQMAAQAKEAAQTKEAISKAAHNEALTEEDNVKVTTAWQGEAANTLVTALQVAKGKAGTSLPGTPQYEAALKLANDEIDKASKTWREKYKGSQAVMNIVDQVDSHDFHSLQDLEQRAQQMQDAVKKSAAAQKPAQSPEGKIEEDFKAGRIDQKTHDAAMAKATHIAQPASIVTANLLNNDAVERAADEFNLTGKLPPSLARNPAAAAKIMDAAAKKQSDAGVKGVDTAVNREANLADSKSLANLTKQSDMISSFENTALKNLDMLVEQSKKVPRSNFPLINKAILTGRLETGDPETAKFYAIVKPFTDEYAKILSGQTGAAGASDTARKEAQGIISPYFSPDQIEKLKPFITQELQNRTGSLRQQQESIQGRMHDRVTGSVKEEKKQEAPSSAIEHLKAHPELKEAFKAKYGYLPDGI